MFFLVRLLREELQLLQEPGSYVGEVIKQMGKSKVLVKVNPEGKYVVDVDKTIDITKCSPNTRVALRNDSYVLHKILPTKVRKIKRFDILLEGKGAHAVLLFVCLL
jgi:26S proteasome regulatory subunit T6